MNKIDERINVNVNWDCYEENDPMLYKLGRNKKYQLYFIFVKGFIPRGSTFHLHGLGRPPKIKDRSFMKDYGEILDIGKTSETPSKRLLKMGHSALYEIKTSEFYKKCVIGLGYYNEMVDDTMNSLVEGELIHYLKPRYNASGVREPGKEKTRVSIESNISRYPESEYLYDIPMNFYINPFRVCTMCGGMFGPIESPFDVIKMGSIFEFVCPKCWGIRLLLGDLSDTFNKKGYIDNVDMERYKKFLKFEKFDTYKIEGSNLTVMDFILEELEESIKFLKTDK